MTTKHFILYMIFLSVNVALYLNYMPFGQISSSIYFDCYMGMLLHFGSYLQADTTDTLIDRYWNQQN